LKVGQVAHLRVLTREKGNAILELSAYAEVRVTIVGIKGLVVAVGTSSPTLRTIAVGASKASMNRNLLHLSLEILRKEGGEVII
jgi:hypothetical protein